MLYDYARASYATRGQAAQTVGPGRPGDPVAAHGITAARGVWVTNEKALLARAGLATIDQVVAEGTAPPGHLTSMVDEARER